MSRLLPRPGFADSGRFSSRFSAGVRPFCLAPRVLPAPLAGKGPSFPASARRREALVCRHVVAAPRVRRLFLLMPGPPFSTPFCLLLPVSVYRPGTEPKTY